MSKKLWRKILSPLSRAAEPRWRNCDTAGHRCSKLSRDGQSTEGAVVSQALGVLRKRKNCQSEEVTIPGALVGSFSLPENENVISQLYIKVSNLTPSYFSEHLLPSHLLSNPGHVSGAWESLLPFTRGPCVFQPRCLYVHVPLMNWASWPHTPAIGLPFFLDRVFIVLHPKNRSLTSIQNFYQNHFISWCLPLSEWTWFMIIRIY